jgi:hypothetical protein
VNKELCPTISPARYGGRRLTAGILTGLIAFLASIPFYGMEGTLVIDQILFKSLMIVIGSLTAAILLVCFF